MTRETTGGQKLVIILGYDPDAFFNMLRTTSSDDLVEARAILKTAEPNENEHVAMLSRAGLKGIDEEFERRKPKKEEKKMRYTIGWIVFGLLVVFGIGWVVRANYFAQESVFAPKEEALRRQTVEESKAYNDGVAQEVLSMQMEYIKSTPDQKAALKSVILHKLAGYDLTHFSADTQKFINDLRHESM